MALHIYAGMYAILSEKIDSGISYSNSEKDQWIRQSRNVKISNLAILMNDILPPIQWPLIA